MEEVLLRFPHIGEEIFNALDEKSLQNCKKVGRTWKRFIQDPNQKLLWIQIIKKQEKDIYIKKYLNSPPKWNKLKIQNLREFAKKLHSTEDCMIKEEVFLKTYAELKIQLGKDKSGYSAFHWACAKDHSKIAEILIQKSVEFNIDLNAFKSTSGSTAFHLACMFHKKSIVEMMLDNVESINFTVKCDIGITGFEYSSTSIANLIKRKLPTGRF